MSQMMICPKCNGQGVIGVPPGQPGSIDEWGNRIFVASQTSWTCDLCNGRMVIPIPYIPEYECTKGHTIPLGIRTCADEDCKDRDERPCLNGCIYLQPKKPATCRHCGGTGEITIPSYYPIKEKCPVCYPADLKPAEPQAEMMPLISDIAKPEQHYTAHCFGCGKEEKLMMIPHRYDEQIVGWIFSCSKCEPYLIEKKLYSENWLPAHDQQVKQTAVKEFALEFVDRMTNCPTSFMPDQITAIEAVLLAMAEGK